MNQNFPRIITLLRKEQGLSQKKAAEQLEISQALLSHYEKGIRECGLEFLVKIADFYGVSCDYLLGRSPNRTGETITIDQIPDSDPAAKENSGAISLLPVLNKKLISNSLNIIYTILQDCNHKGLTIELSSYLSASVYKAFRLLYSANPKNPQGMFAASPKLYSGMANALQNLSEAHAICLSTGDDLGDFKALDRDKVPALSPEILSEKFPLFSSSLFNLILNTEKKMGLKIKDHP